MICLHALCVCACPRAVLTDANIDSISRSHHPRSRHPPRSFCSLLPLYISSATQNDRTLLGLFFFRQRRSNPTEISKWNTFFQLGLIAATMLDLAMGGFPATGVEVMGYPITGTNALELSWWIVGGTTIWSGLSYVGGRKGLRILSKR